MKTIKKYGFALKLMGAALLIGLALILEFGNGEPIIVSIIGATIVIYAVVRLVPYVKTQKNDLVKTINIMEITVDVLIGIAMIVIEFAVEGGLGSALGYILGVYLILRGSVHFYGVSVGQEKSDIVLYFFHISALVVGGLVLLQGDIDAALIIHIILAFSIVVGGYLFYDGGKGYKVYRYEKSLYDTNVATKEEAKEVPILDEEQEQDRIVS
jgi:uncharacterized membrane protein HdeD (DUF308 family)